MKICVYHGIDFDGKCSAAIMLRKYPEIKLIPWNYGWSVDPILQEINEETEFFFCDITLPMENMRAIAAKAKSVVCLDHHKTVLDNELFQIFGSFENVNTTHCTVDFSGCEITWLYAYSYIPIPIFVKMLGRYDMWDKKCEISFDRLCEFQLGLKAHDPTVEELSLMIWQFQMIDIDDIVRNGYAISRYLGQQNKNSCRFAYMTNFVAEYGGFSVAAINSTEFGSKTLDGFESATNADIRAVYCQQPDGWIRLSLYSDKSHINCGAICKQLNPKGGGHAGAAGCVVQSIAHLPWNI